MTVQPVEAFTPYATAMSMFQALPTWMPEYDAERVSSYQVYEQIYWNVPETFKLTFRGEENAPIYVPTGRVIVDTTNRYLCTKPGFLMDPEVGTPEQREEMRRWYSKTFRRERFWSKFNANKRYGVMRGDWVWHILANPAKPPGTRIKIEPIDPAAYFPITHPNDPDHIIAVHIVEQFLNEDGDTMIKRQTYQRGADPVKNDGSDTTIYNSIGIFDIEAWLELSQSPVQVIKPPTALPAPITAIPVYHIRNMETPGDPFGSSELRGLERIMGAVNQAISDEELILALEGLGMYETDGGPPRDAAGNITDWILGPGAVVEHTMGSTFNRVSGVTTVAPMQDHLSFLIKSIKESSATPDIAIGSVDVTVAESGIARWLQLSPLLAKVDERADIVSDVHNQMYFDMTAWFKAYEGVPADNPAVAQSIWGDPVPEDRAAQVKEILEIVAAGLADAEWGREQLALLGYDFPNDMADRIVSEMQAKARAQDPFATRMAQEDELEEGEGAE